MQRARDATCLLCLLLVGVAGGAQAQQVVRMPGAQASIRPSTNPSFSTSTSRPSVIRVLTGLTDASPSVRTNGHRVAEWAPLIKQAATRFGIPELWIREVMRMESGGNPQALSWAGAMGLMQVIPSTYARMRWQHGLGPNPWEPRDNILAGAAYIREMYDLYGFPAFLAAYNAGPGRVEGFMNSTSLLPAETLNYISVLAPRLQGTTIAEGPLAAFVPPDGARPSLAAQSASPGPLRVDMRHPSQSPQASLAAENGLIPRGMLDRPQLIKMPSLTASLATPVAIPPEVLNTMLAAARR